MSGIYDVQCSHHNSPPHFDATLQLTHASLALVLQTTLSVTACILSDLFSGLYITLRSNSWTLFRIYFGEYHTQDFPLQIHSLSNKIVKHSFNVLL